MLFSHNMPEIDNQPTYLTFLLRGNNYLFYSRVAAMYKAQLH